MGRNTLSGCANLCVEATYFCFVLHCRILSRAIEPKFSSAECSYRLSIAALSQLDPYVPRKGPSIFRSSAFSAGLPFVGGLRLIAAPLLSRQVAVVD